MDNATNKILIEKIIIGFKKIVSSLNYADSHQQIKPFGTKWGRGIIVKGSNYTESITGPYGITHSLLKNSLESNEQTIGTFYYGYDYMSKTLYLEYGMDNHFDFRDPIILNAITNSLKNESGPLKNCVFRKKRR